MYPRSRVPSCNFLIATRNFYYFYFILRHGARGLRSKDEKESRKVETVTAAKETRKHTSKQANKQTYRRSLLASPLLRITVSSPVIHRLRKIVKT
jgi:hypothetical protein